jgi:hypothetical protein
MAKYGNKPMEFLRKVMSVSDEHLSPPGVLPALLLDLGRVRGLKGGGAVALERFAP